MLPAGTRFRAAPLLSYVRDICLGHCTTGSDWDRTRIAFLVGLLGSPDWEIKRKALEHTTVKDINSQFSYASSSHSKPDPSGYISLGFLPLDILRLFVQPVSATSSECSIDWVELLGPQDYVLHRSRLLCPLQANHSFTFWTALRLPLKAPWEIFYRILRS